MLCRHRRHRHDVFRQQPSAPCSTCSSQRRCQCLSLTCCLGNHKQEVIGTRSPGEAESTQRAHTACATATQTDHYNHLKKVLICIWSLIFQQNSNADWLMVAKITYTMSGNIMVVDKAVLCHIFMWDRLMTPELLAFHLSCSSCTIYRMHCLLLLSKFGSNYTVHLKISSLS